MEPGNRQTAPQPLELVQAFVNTNDLLEKRETLASPDLLRKWLIERGLLSDKELLSEEDLQRMLKVREAIRSLLLANDGDPVDSEAIETLNHTARNAQLVIAFHHDGYAHLETNALGLDEAISRILTTMFAAMTDGSWKRLKVCSNEECRWAYYDTSKNRSGTWCTMSICGNRIKARNYRQRHQVGE